MKKEYTKPMAQMEKLTFDMQFAANTSADWYQEAKNAFESNKNVFDVDGDGVLSEAEWNAFLPKFGYDNSTSGYCYFSNVKPS